MIESVAPFSISITSMGPVARRTVARMGQGRVAAVFDRSFYIEYGDEFVCIGVPALIPGPLTASADVPSGMNWASSGIRDDARVSGADGILSVGDRFRFHTRSAQQWSPPPFPGLASGAVPMDAVLSDVRAMAPTDGLAPILFRGAGTGPMSPVVNAAWPAHRRMSDWVLKVAAGIDASPPEESVCRLLGLGPGLTPSGDDYLGGMMIALHAFGYGQAVERLYAIIDREAPRRTNRISAAHLAATREGWGAAPLHDMLNLLVTETGPPLPSLIYDVDRIGHTSGWDALTGILTVVQVWSSSARGSSWAA
jgi:Protein of unknown function (DUF2877)